MTEMMGLSVRERLGLDRLGGEPEGGFAFTNADGDQVSVRSFDDGTLVTECANGTTSVHTPDGSSRSVNDPLGGAPIFVAADPDGGRVTELPNGKTETVQPDGTTRTANPDGSTVAVHPDGQVDLELPGQPPATGLRLDEAVAQGHLTDVQLVSTGNNLGPVAVLVGTCTGSVPFVWVPPSVLTPADAVTNQTLDTHPTVVDTATPGTIEAEIPGACRNDPALPPAPSGDTAITLQPPPAGDPTVHIPDIVTGAVDAGVIPPDLVGTPADTVQTLDQVTRWLRHDATPAALVGFLLPRIPGTPPEKQHKAEQITDWGARLVDKTRNLDKQVAGAPEVPPGFLASIPGASTATSTKERGSTGTQRSGADRFWDLVDDTEMKPTRPRPRPFREFSDDMGTVARELTDEELQDAVNKGRTRQRDLSERIRDSKKWDELTPDEREELLQEKRKVDTTLEELRREQTRRWTNSPEFELETERLEWQRERLEDLDKRTEGLDWLDRQELERREWDSRESDWQELQNRKADPRPATPPDVQA